MKKPNPKVLTRIRLNHIYLYLNCEMKNYEIKNQIILSIYNF